MMIRTAFLFLLLLAGGCRQNVADLDANEAENRMLASAAEKVANGEYGAGVLLITKAIETYPEYAKSHLDLALLQHDRKDLSEAERDYVTVIYNYQRYLEMRPSSEKKEMIGKRIHQAILGYARSEGETPDAAAARRIEKLENAHAALVQESSALEKENESLRKQSRNARGEIEKLRTTIKALNDKLEIHQAPAQPVAPVKRTVAAVPPTRPEASLTGSDEGRTVAPVAPKEPPSGPRSYTVRPGDSLSEIAQKVYGDGSQWRKIQAANRSVLGNKNEVQVGQVLTIP